MTIDTLKDLAKARRIVVKVGSALLVDEGKARQSWLMALARDIAVLRDHGCEVIVVCSGAIALGAATLKLEKGGRGSLADAQAAAAVGQIALANLWSRALGEVGLNAAQMLLTIDDLEDRRRYLNGSATLDRLLEAGTVPVINENDSVATEEIRFGDNDRLAARLAQAAGADVVLLLSDVDGLYDRDPKSDGAALIRRIDGITPEILAMATPESSSGLGSGGMTSKLQAAEIAERAGILLAIVNGTHDAPISHAIKADHGTIFVPQRRDRARKGWLSGRLAPAGSLVVDEGCAQALKEQGASVLAVGITAVEGSFDRGDLVIINGPDGERLGQGLSEYDAVSCRRIAGMREDHQAKILGHAPRAAVVHRDHMVLA